MGTRPGWDASSQESWPVQDAGLRKVIQQVPFWGEKIEINLDCFISREWGERRIHVWKMGNTEESNRDGSRRLDTGGGNAGAGH